MTYEGDTVVEEKCDGSGWITHGDGHKTECPGCSACQSNTPEEPDAKPESGCQCGCEREECKCQETGECFPLPSASNQAVKKKLDSSEGSSLYLEEDKQKYNVYHFGAKWCAPCEKMKKQTWSSDKVKSAIKENEAKLFIFDESNPEHKKFFLFYKIKLYPTIIFVESDNLSEQVYRASGFVGPEEMSQTIKEKLKDE